MSAGLITSEDLPCGIEVILLRKHKKAKKKQWREFLAGIQQIAAALYWLVKLIHEILNW